MTFSNPHTIILLYDNIASLCAGAAASAALPKDRRDTVHMEREYKMSAARAQELQEELNYLKTTRSDEVAEQIKVARGFGDLSENFEYKAAKREKNKNESRIRYLENMIKTARVIEDRSAPDTVGLYDKVTIYLEEDGEEESWQVVTTVRQDVLNGLISKESPMGAALLGKKVGERFYVQVNQDYGYYAVVRAIQKGADDGSAQLNRY